MSDVEPLVIPTVQLSENAKSVEGPLCISQVSQQPNPLSLHVLALLIPASSLGMLARLGLQYMGTYDGNIIFPLVYAQSIGCLIMGFALGLKDPFSRFYPPLFTALTTGFCGSLTTFSGWQLDIFNSWINAGEFHRSGLQDFLDGTAKSVYTLSISLTSVSFGMQLSSVIIPYIPAVPPPSQTMRYVLSTISILSYAAIFPAYFLLPPESRHKATAALLFAYPGTLTRYIISVKLNPLMKSMPLGTLAVNSFGTALLGAFHILQNLSHPLSASACGMLQGLSDGYCGCLTTVSTFAVEVRGLKRWNGFWYALISWSVGQILLLVLLGPLVWSGQAKEVITCKFL